MKKLIFALLVIALVLLSFNWGCSKKLTQKTGPQTAKVPSPKVEKSIDMPTAANLPESVAKEAHQSLVKTLEDYLQKAFLDLKIARSNLYNVELLGFFTKDAQTMAVSDFSLLSLSPEQKKLHSIANNDLQIPLISINYDESHNPSLGTVRFDFSTQYKINLQKIDLKFFGELVFVKQEQDWKIFTYKLHQSLK